MNAKELREAAIDITNHGNELARMADHILATVRDDDDEPVNAEWLHSLFCDSNSAWWYLDKTRQKVVTCEHGKPADVWVSPKPFAVSDGEQDSLLCEVTSRGQFRSLCRGLGIELKEGGK